MLGVGPITRGQTHGLQLYPAPTHVLPVAAITAQLSFLLSAHEQFPLELHSPRATESLECGASELRCTVSIRYTGFLKMY